MKKISIVVGLLILISLITPTIANESDFAENEAYYRELCTSTITSEERAVCTSFQEYLNSKIETAQGSIDDLNKEISAVENDIAKVDELMRQQHEQIVAAEKEIEELDATIVAIEENITKLEGEIAERSAEIEKVDKQIKERLVSEQGNLYTNSVVNYLFGGRSYTEMVRRADTVNKINEYNKNQMDWFTAEKKRLVDDQEELERQKTVQQDTLENVKSLKVSLEAAKKQSEETIALYKAQVEELTEKQLELQSQQSISQADMDSIKDAFVDLDAREEQLRLEAERLAREAEEERRRAQELADEEARLEAERKAQELQDQSDQANKEADDVANSGGNSASGWILPVNSAYISAGVWYYPGDFVYGGSVHYGVDFATPVGTPI